MTKIWKMNKGRILSLIVILCMVVCILPVRIAYASDSAVDQDEALSDWIQDGAGLLTESEVQSLQEKSEQILEKYGISVVVVTTDRFEGYDILDWERTLYEEQNLGAGENKSCLMLGVSMAERDWGITAYGDAEEIFGSYSREKIGGEILDDLSDGDYYEAFDRYLELAEQFMKDAEDGKVYSASNPYKEPVNIGVIIIGAFVLSLVISLVVVLSWKRKMNTKVLQSSAGAYLKNGRAAITGRSDIYLYRTVRRTRRQKESHGSGGMRSSGNGTKGKF